jgi:hypothetical protein
VACRPQDNPRREGLFCICIFADGFCGIHPFAICMYDRTPAHHNHLPLSYDAGAVPSTREGWWRAISDSMREGEGGSRQASRRELGWHHRQEWGMEPSTRGGKEGVTSHPIREPMAPSMKREGWGKERIRAGEKGGIGRCGGAHRG